MSKVLIIDDDAALVRMIRLALLSEGLEVRTAQDGRQGLEETASERYDLILLDLNMPVMDGREFYRAFRARGDTTPVVLLSAYGAQAAHLELGAEAAITKPFDPVVLLGTIRALLPSEMDCEAGLLNQRRD